jgi:hypothetical protein
MVLPMPFAARLMRVRYPVSCGKLSITECKKLER